MTVQSSQIQNESNIELIVDYINKISLLTCFNEFKFISKLIKKGLSEGDKISVNDKKESIVLPFNKTPKDGLLYYSPIKKNGEISKRVLILYGNLNIKKIC